MLLRHASALIALMIATAPAHAAEMKATAPDKMTSPADKQKMKTCEATAAAQNVRMDERARFVMDCMTAK